MTTTETPATLTIAGTDYPITDTGTTWFISDLRPFFALVNAGIERTYQRQAAIAAESGRTLSVPLGEVILAFGATNLPAMAEAGISTLRPDFAAAPHEGDWASTTPERVAQVLEHMLTRVSDWTVTLIERDGLPL